jgi:hypothetical protein
LSQVHAPSVHALVFPEHCDVAVQEAQPSEVQTSPLGQAGPPLQPQAPDVQVLAFAPQSTLLQQSVDGTHTLPHDLCPVGQPQPALVHVLPAWQGGAALHLQTLSTHVLLSPVHSASEEHVVHPGPAHTMPPSHAAIPLHVQLPAVHVLVSPLQSALVQQAASAMQSSSQSLVPVPHATAWAASASASTWAESDRPMCDAPSMLASTCGSVTLPAEAHPSGTCATRSAHQLQTAQRSRMVSPDPAGPTSRTA